MKIRIDKVQDLADRRVARLLAWFGILRRARLEIGEGDPRGRVARRIRTREEEVWDQLSAILGQGVTR